MSALSQPISELEKRLTRAPSSPPGTRFAALLMLLMCTNRHLYVTSTFSDTNIIWHAHPRSNLPDVYLTDRWRYRYTLVCKHNRCRWQLYGVVVFIKYVFNTCRRANETATLQIKLMWIARAANVQAV